MPASHSQLSKLNLKLFKKFNNCITTPMLIVVDVLARKALLRRLFLHLFLFTPVVMLENCPEVDEDKLF